MALSILQALLQDYLESLLKEGILNDTFRQVISEGRLKEPNVVVEQIHKYFDDVETILCDLHHFIELCDVDFSILATHVRAMEEKSTSSDLMLEVVNAYCGDSEKNPCICEMKFFVNAAELVIRESVEPLLEDYRPPGITSLKFNKLTLGTVPPKIEGTHRLIYHLNLIVQRNPCPSLRKSQIIMDMDLRWGGDPNIILGVQAAGFASIPIQLKDLQVFTIVRVIFQLSEEIPCISAVVVALLADPSPRIDYTLKAVAGSLTALPGISDMIDDTVDTIVNDTLKWPHRIVVPISTSVDTSDLELKPQGKLTVTVVKANDLKNKEIFGKSDPYTVIYIRPLFKVKTKVVEDNLNPIWNETFHVIAEDKETQSLIIEVCDKDIGQDKDLGFAKLPLIDLVPDTPTEIELRLTSLLDMSKTKDKKDRGTITLKVVYHPFNKEEQNAALEAEKRSVEEKKKMKEAGLVGSTVDALDGPDGRVFGGGLAGLLVAATLIQVVLGSFLPGHNQDNKPKKPRIDSQTPNEMMLKPSGLATKVICLTNYVNPDELKDVLI
ncbi:calcium-dependent lipid-binding protein-like [Silene latifolia]|uniref:calcium-dependent lipid-binding protein-like n=1 Tax=Silene latifolia TaxID=37657 RepID=UPI003D788675